MLDIHNLPVESKLQLDIESFAAQIEFDLAEYIKEAPKGIYIANRLEPVMVDGIEYYSGDLNQNKPLDVVTDINNIKTAVYDKDCKIIIPKQFMINKERFLSNHSILPYRGIKIIEILAKEQLYASLQYLSRRPSASIKLQTHLVGIETDEDLEHIHSECTRIAVSVLRDIERFIGKDDWYIYSISLRERVIDIEKHIDHRIYEWTKMQHGDNSNE
jgi:hypothetical protein